MKTKNLFFLSALITALGLIPAGRVIAQPCVTPPTGLAAWWRAEGNALDNAGTNNGTLVNGAGFATGLVGQAFSLNGVNQRVDVPNSAALAISGPITVEAWIKRAVTGAQHSIVEKYSFTVGGFGLRVGSNDKVVFFTTDPSFQADVLSGATTLGAGIWYHVAGVWDGANLKIYVNGVLDSTVSSLRNPKTGSTPLRIGARGDDAGTAFAGLIDEVDIFNRALSVSEIQMIYQAGVAGKCVQPGTGPPIIQINPQSSFVSTGAVVYLNVSALGSSPLSYQWQLNGVNISGATNSLLVVNSGPRSSRNIYSVTVTNGIGTVRSKTAAITCRQSDFTGIVGWGSNNYGQANSFDGYSMVSIATGNRHTLGLTRDGTVFGYGWNSYGQTTAPAGLNGVTAIAAGLFHSLALKSDGTVVGWGNNGYGQTVIPSGVIAIAAAQYHSLALKSDHTVFGCGINGDGEFISSPNTIPSGLNGVVAISAGEYHNLALKNDGTVVGFGLGPPPIPVGLNGVIAISAGNGHDLALKTDGTVIGWGDNTYGQTNVPVGLNSVIGVAAGRYHSLSLKSDGTVVSWGDNGFGETVIPAGLNNVVGIAAAETYSLALVVRGLFDQTVAAGTNLVLNESFGFGPLPFSTYQWTYNSTNIQGATNTTLILTSLTTNQTGVYAMVISNGSSVFTNAALLKVLLPVTITQQPKARAVIAGEGATMNVVASGSAPFNYQWYFNNVLISGETSDTLILTNIGSTNVGNYYVVVGNELGQVQSQPALVSINYAVRRIPVGYWPNVSMNYTNKAAPPVGTLVYAVQDQLSVYPNNGQTGSLATNIIVGAISDGGTFDAKNFIIKWGPFFDDTPRTLTYILTPPAGTTNWAQFSGIISISGTNYPVAGDNAINLLPLHPADNSPPISNRININDVTAYGAAWKVGNLWPVEPNPIPINYVTSAGLIWKQGEYYIYNPDAGAAPLCWVNTSLPSGIIPLVAVSKVRSLGTDNTGEITPLDLTTSTAICNMTNIYTSNVLFTVTLVVTPETNVNVYAVEDQIPSGWKATNFSNSGIFDGINNKVKWGPFFDHSARLLTYQAIPGSNSTSTVTFSGTASFDGVGLPISGVRQVNSSSVARPSIVSISLSGTNLVINGSNGQSGGTYKTLMNTNLTQPLNQWTPIATNVLTSNGNFTIIATNAVNRNIPQRFYILMQ